MAWHEKTEDKDKNVLFSSGDKNVKQTIDHDKTKTEGSKRNAIEGGVV